MVTEEQPKMEGDDVYSPNDYNTFSQAPCPENRKKQ